MNIKISALPTATEVTGNDESPGVQYGSTKKFSMSQISEYILNTFSSLSLGGITQTVKSAIDSIATLLGSSPMGTTSTTVTGAIAEHSTTLNNNFTDEDVSSMVNIPFTAVEKSIIKRGDIVRVHVELLLTTFMANYNYTLWTMPDSLKPKRPVFAVGYQTDSNYLNVGSATIGLRSNGNVQATFENATSPYVFIEFEYTLA